MEREKVIKEWEFRSIAHWADYHIRNGAEIIATKQGVPLEARYKNPIMEMMKPPKKEE